MSEQGKKQLKKAKEKIESKKSINTINNKIIKSNKKTFNPTKNINKLNNTYTKLLEGSIINTKTPEGTQDTELINILIENRERLQHRFNAEIYIGTTKGTAIMNIDGILAEHIHDIYNYIQIGQTYTSQELKESLNKAQEHFETQYGSIGGNIITPAETKTTITEIQFSMTFA